MGGRPPVASDSVQRTGADASEDTTIRAGRGRVFLGAVRPEYGVSSLMCASGARR